MRLYKRKNIWYLDFTIEGKRIRKAVGTSKKEAQQALDIAKGKVLSGKFDIREFDPSITLQELADLYIPYAKANKKSWERDLTSLRSLLPVFGEKMLKDITPFDVEKYKLDRKERVTPATVNRELALIKHMFNLAIKWKRAFNNPVKEVKLFKENNKRRRFLTQEEIDKLIGCCQPQLKPLVITALTTGMRKSEILNLKWQDVDFGTNLITIKDSKGGESRQIPINDTLREILFEIKKESQHEHVFLNIHGEPYKDFRTAFKKAKNGAALKDFTFHDLRHTFASHLVMANVNLKTVQELLGHKSMQMTMRYSHLSEEYKGRAVNILSRRIGSEKWHKSGTTEESKNIKKAEKPIK